MVIGKGGTMAQASRTDRVEVALGLGVDWAARRLYITGTVTDESAYKLLPVIHTLDETKGPICVHLASSGGSESGGFALYDTLRCCKNRVFTLGTGEILSVAALILQAGDVRAMTPSAQFMIHGVTASLPECDMDAVAVRRLASSVANSDRRYRAVLAERSGNPFKTVSRWCDDETYFTAPQALESGFIDAIQQRVK